MSWTRAQAEKNYPGRESREFYSVETQGPVTGFATQEPRCWWVPEMGSSVWVGKHIADTRAAALLLRRAELVSIINKAERSGSR